MRLIYWKICGTFAKKPAGFGAYQAWALSGLGLMKCGPNIVPELTGTGRGPFQLYLNGNGRMIQLCNVCGCALYPNCVKEILAFAGVHEEY